MAPEGYWAGFEPVAVATEHAQNRFMVQIPAGLITYLLLAIYCHSKFQENVSIRRVRQLRIQIENELRRWTAATEHQQYEKEQNLQNVKAKT